MKKESENGREKEGKIKENGREGPCLSIIFPPDLFIEKYILIMVLNTFILFCFTLSKYKMK